MRGLASPHTSFVNPILLDKNQSLIFHRLRFYFSLKQNKTKHITTRVRLIIHQVAIYLRVEGMQVGRTGSPAGFQESPVGLPEGLAKILPTHQLPTLHLAAS